MLIIARRQFGQFASALHNRQVLSTLSCSTLLIATNWLVFIYAVQQGEVLQSSLGYFITPLISVLLGGLFLHERLNRWQLLSILFAIVGVLNLALQLGRFPWIALTLATSFGLYGLLRKVVRVEAMVGLAVETLLLGPAALGYLVYLASRQENTFFAGTLRLDLLLPLSGVVTAIPLLLFVGAARRLQLTTIGFLQYITPSLHFILAVVLYKEPFSTGLLISFFCIWLGLGIFSSDALWKNRSGWLSKRTNRSH